MTLEAGSEAGKGLVATTLSGDDPQYVEAHSLGQGPALPNDDVVAFSHSETRRTVCWNILVPLLVPLVLFDVVHVISPHNDSPSHLGAVHHSCQYTAADGYTTSEGTLLVNVLAFNSLTGRFETKSNRFVPSFPGFSRHFFDLLTRSGVPGLYTQLLLVCPFVLFRHTSTAVYPTTVT